MMRVEFGINTCFAVKRWPLPTDWAPIVREQLGLSLVQHSFDLVEPGGSRNIQSQVAAIQSAVNASGLVVHSTFTGLAAYSANLLLHPDVVAREAATDWYRDAIDFSARLGAAGTGGHIGAFSVADWGAPERRRERWVELQERLDSLAHEAARRGLSYLLVENLAAAREPSTMEMIHDLVTEGDEDRVPIRLCLDVGHMCVPGTDGADRDPYAWLKQLGRVAPVVQLQQSDSESDHHWPFTAERNQAGRIEADRVLDALGEGEVQSTALILEVIPPFEQEDASVLDDLRASVGYWKEALSRRGLLAA